jgi:gas vesicle protein
MDNRTQNGPNNGVLIGLIAGSVIGAGLALAFAPRLRSEFRRLTASANDLSRAASRSYGAISTRVTEAVDGVAARGQSVRDDVADAVGRGARQVEQIAMASKTGRTTRQS